MDSVETKLGIRVVLTLSLFKVRSHLSQPDRCSSSRLAMKARDRVVASGNWSVARQWLENNASVTFVTSNSTKGETIVSVQLIIMIMSLA